MTDPKLYLFLVVSLTIGFPLGFYSHKVVSEAPQVVESDRAPASKDPDGGDPRVSHAIKECITDGPKENSVQFSKVGVDGRKWTIVAIDCQGSKAKSLFEAVAPYSTEQFVNLKDKRAGIGRFFGQLHPPSQCVRLVKNAKGSEMNLYNCSLHMDLDQELVHSLKL